MRCVNDGDHKLVLGCRVGHLRRNLLDDAAHNDAELVRRAEPASATLTAWVPKLS